MKKLKRKTKWMGLLLSLCMVLSIVPLTAVASALGTASISVTFRQGSENYGWIEIKNGTDWTRYNGSEAQNAEAVRICPNTDYSVDWAGIFLRVNGTDILTDDIRNQLTGENGYTLTAGTEYALENVEFRQGNGGTPGPEPGGEPAHGGYEGEQKTASVTVTGKADFYINDSRMVNANDGDNFNDVDYHYDGNGYVDFYFNCFINERITALRINGVDYYNNLPNPSTEEGKAALLDACKGQLNEFKITVSYSENGYAIESNVKWLDDTDKDYMVVGNFLWTYTEENQGDDYIDHGRMELLGVNYKGTDYLPDDLNNPGTAIDWGWGENGGSAVLPVGAVVTVKLVPDYGYQLTSFGINGGDFGTGDEQSTFTFEIKPGNAHLGAHFTLVADKVTSSSDAVTSGNIELGSGLSGGSAQLEISDAKNELSDEKLEAFETAAGNYTITDYLNLDLYNVYYKGSTDADDVWKNEVNTLDNNATISVSLADSPLGSMVNPSDIVIIHNVHNGEDFETIPVDSYDSETNTITFKTDSFSTYAIATTMSAGVDTVDYSIIEGANGSWTQNTDGTLTFRANGDFSKFTGVKVDGTLIDAKNYTAVSGSTVITLNTNYLKTLSFGTHIITVVYTDGECSANFEVKKAASEQTKPTEGENPDAASAWLESLGNRILAAASDSTVRVTKDEEINTLSNEIMQMLVKRGDVALEMEYTYQGMDYHILIPAGRAVDNDIPWYGPLYLAAHFGAGEAAADMPVANGVTVVVKKGDTLSGIARRYHTTLARLAAINPQIKNLNRIIPGQVIRID